MDGKSIPFKKHQSRQTACSEFYLKPPIMESSGHASYLTPFRGSAGEGGGGSMGRHGPGAQNVGSGPSPPNPHR